MVFKAPLKRANQPDHLSLNQHLVKSIGDRRVGRIFGYKLDCVFAKVEAFVHGLLMVDQGRDDFAGLRILARLANHMIAIYEKYIIPSIITWKQIIFRLGWNFEIQSGLNIRYFRQPVFPPAK